MNMPTDDLKQTLLELYYDLLDEDEAQAWRDRIGSDPKVAAAWAETLRLAGKLASAAKIEGTPLPEIDTSRIKAQAAPVDPNNSAVTGSVQSALQLDQPPQATSEGDRRLDALPV